MRKKKMLDIINKRYYFFALSLLIIIPGFVIIFSYGLPLSIDFEGGSLVELEIQSASSPMRDKFIDIYAMIFFENFISNYLRHFLL